MKVFFSIILCATVLINCEKSAEAVRTFKPSFKESTTTTHKIPDDQSYTFGYLEVLENRAKSNGKTIKLPVYIFKSRNPKPKKDPIIYTVGGPGYSSMRSAQYMKYYQYLDDRDFILFEQRGVQYARPNLACPEWSKAIYQSNLPAFDETQSEQLFMDVAKACRDRLSNMGIDLDAYNTKEIAADIEDLREALGIDKYNLLTISYSTKIAQVLIRDYPSHIRSVVMDSPLPLEVNYDEESVDNLLSALKDLLADCALDAKCRQAYPNLAERFLSYLREKTTHPLRVEVAHPVTAKEEVFYLKGKDLIQVFTNASSEDIPNIPSEINKLLSNDLSALKNELSALFVEPNNGDGRGMRLSVWCAEEYPFLSQAKIKEETNRYPELSGLSPAVFDAAICEIWAVKKAEMIENRPVKSDIPVLILNGSYDHETPAKWGLGMKKHLSNSFHLLFKGWTHTVTTNWNNPCAMQASNEFFNNPNQKPKLACLETIEQVKFSIR